jgi:serine/threonine-protein kinase
VTEGIPVREGELLAGKYRVERVLGSGGMGVVVSAVHTQLDQRVAIKFVREEALGNEDAVQRFLREARAAVKLKSEHAARVIDVGTLESGAPYMVMEYLEGSDLATVLQERGVLAAQVAAEWIVQACEAIAEAHALGIVHRDIKPQNLFLAKTVGGQPRVKVLDFGVSKSLDSSSARRLTQTRAMLGSPLYMSPEQMRSSRGVDARSDVWALGVVIYELVTRRLPFEAESMPELCLKVVSDAPTPVTAYRADLPKVMVDVIERCLQKDPALRYANAAELAAALEAIAPPGSSAVVERARLAMQSMASVTEMGSAGDAAPSNAVSARQGAADVVARTAVTPATWDSDHVNRPPAAELQKKTAWGVWLGFSGLVVAASVAALLLLPRHGASPAAAGTTGAAVVTAPAVPPAAATLVPVPPPAVTAAAGASPDPPPSAALAPPGSSAMPTAHPSVPVAPPATKPVPAPHPAATTSGKPKPVDDDIPSLR